MQYSGWKHSRYVTNYCNIPSHYLSPLSIQHRYGVYYHLETTPSETHTRWSDALLKDKGSDQNQNQHQDKGSDQDQVQQGDKGWLSLPPPNPFISYDLATSPILSDTTPRSNNNNNNDDNNENNNKDNINTPTTTSPQRTLRSPPPVRLPSDAQEQGQGQGQGLPVFSWLSQDAVFNQPKTVFQLLLHTDRDNEIADGHPANSLISSVHAQLVSTKVQTWCNAPTLPPTHTHSHTL